MKVISRDTKYWKHQTYVLHGVGDSGLNKHSSEGHHDPISEVVDVKEHGKVSNAGEDKTLEECSRDVVGHFAVQIYADDGLAVEIVSGAHGQARLADHVLGQVL